MALFAGSFLATTSHAAQIVVTANHHHFHATLAHNSSANAFRQKLKSGPVIVKAHNFENMEKVGNLPWSLPRNDRDFHARAGDIILYQGNQLTLYYNDNEWDFTPIAHIPNVTTQQMRHSLGHSKVDIKYSLVK